MKTLLAGLCALVLAVWGWDVAQATWPATAHPWWIARQELLYLSGLLSIALMSLAMLLATRPGWLEAPLGGMDRIYRTHKWAGIIGIGLAAAHWLVEMGDDILKSTIGREGRLPKEKYTGFLEVLRDLAKDMGEWAIYAVLLMLVITLWRRFPYRAWRFLHRAMPVLYLVLAFHAVLLAPRDYWQQPLGALVAVLVVAGSYGAFRALAGGIGRTRRHAGSVVAIEHPAPEVTSVRCKMGDDWPGHRPGQFAFVTFDAREGGHPFTIASADQGDGTIAFQIKALGDYTGTLAQWLAVGQPVGIEGPYGCFDLDRCDARARQIWIAGGIGVTPFLAWLEALSRERAHAPVAELHYCTRDSATDPFVGRLQALCAHLPSVRLTVHDASAGDRLQAAALSDAASGEVWFCGPSGLADTLRAELARLGRRPRFHQEAFEMR
ncbi:MAG TPA: ferric reductase-like transmembrane domain-containing protein [Accumulibacter sp.]|uniref:ferredoxin reductase family protein n=1 Tax=Accumulibacter sp. TaxID=2053492 RepID=UPI002C734F68|nr:ferric reductase-like transmembrane domain-containing protein [Accumulibacter sp.]HRD90318.1 ferric reductase-like transmembrane domain-containing protein [Accumulibacter sp.]